MFAFLGLVKIMHVIRRKWLLSLPVGNSVHRTTALCLIKDRESRSEEASSGKCTEKIDFCFHLIIIWGGGNINHCRKIRYIILKLIRESSLSLNMLIRTYSLQLQICTLFLQFNFILQPDLLFNLFIYRFRPSTTKLYSKENK